MVKNVVYNDDLSTPTSRTIWMMIVPMAANGGNYNATAIPAKITYVVDYRVQGHVIGRRDVRLLYYDARPDRVVKRREATLTHV